jgi:hypothetical protein
MGKHLRPAAGNHWQAVFVEQLNPQPFRGVIDQQAFFQLRELRHFMEFQLQFLLRFFELFILDLLYPFLLQFLFRQGLIAGGFLAPRSRLGRRQVDDDAVFGGRAFGTPSSDEMVAPERMSPLPLVDPATLTGAK